MSVVRKIVRILELPEEQRSGRWSNEDILPVPTEKQKWGPIQFVELWFLVNMNAIIVIVIGNALAAGFAVLNSVSGAKHHIGFPIVSRSVWGMWGSFFPILNRILLSVVWFGVQSVIGGRMIYVCLRSIWMNLDDRIHNTLPAKTGITTGEFMCFVIFNLLCCLMMWLRPGQLRPYFHGASVVVCITLFVMLGWAVGTSPTWGAVSKQKATKPASELAWTMCSGIMSVIGSIAAGILNQNDFTRFAKRPSHVTWSQGVSFLLSGTLTATIGVLVTSATQEQYGHGVALWDPDKLFKAIQDQHGSKGRAAAFFLAAVMIMSQLSINVVGNVLAGGLDVVAVAPRFFNLRRGAYAILILSILPNPWQQLTSGSTFLVVLGAYAVFVGPMIGLLCTHYYIIQKQQFHIPDLYEGNNKSLYWYWHGVNWRTVLAWTLAVVPNMPGFIHGTDKKLWVPIGAQRVYDLSFLVGFLLASVLAVLLNYVFPYKYHVPVTHGSEVDAQTSDGMEEQGGEVDAKVDRRPDSRLKHPSEF